MPIHRLAVLALLAFALAACTHAPPRNPMAQWVPSPNFGPRQPVLIVIPATEQASVQESLDPPRPENRGGPGESLYLAGAPHANHHLVAAPHPTQATRPSPWGH